LNNKNSSLQRQILDRKEKKTLQDKGKLDPGLVIPKPEIDMWGKKRQCDKMEPNRLEIKDDNSLKFTIKT
jgi:hypothetical protein